MDEKQIAYFAGLFDGEGWVRFATVNQGKWRKSPSFMLTVGINNCHPKPLILLQQEFGGKFYCNERYSKNPKHRTLYQWTIFSHKAFIFLAMIKPHLIIKLDEVNVAFELFGHIYKNKGVWGYHKPIPQEVIAYRESLVQKLSDLKHRNYPMFDNANSENSVDALTDGAEGNTEPSLLS